MKVALCIIRWAAWHIVEDVAGVTCDASKIVMEKGPMVAYEAGRIAGKAPTKDELKFATGVFYGAFKAGMEDARKAKEVEVQ